MKKVFNWLKRNDRFWWILIISITLAVIIGTVFFWDWLWKLIFILWIFLYLFISGSRYGYEAWEEPYMVLNEVITRQLLESQLKKLAFLFWKKGG